jgi:hypothetical protein
MNGLPGLWNRWMELLDEALEEEPSETGSTESQE